MPSHSIKTIAFIALAATSVAGCGRTFVRQSHGVILSQIEQSQLAADKSETQIQQTAGVVAQKNGSANPVLAKPVVQAPNLLEDRLIQDDEFFEQKKPARTKEQPADEAEWLNEVDASTTSANGKDKGNPATTGTRQPAQILTPRNAVANKSAVKSETATAQRPAEPKTNVATAATESTKTSVVAEPQKPAANITQKSNKPIAAKKQVATAEVRKTDNAAKISEVKPAKPAANNQEKPAATNKVAGQTALASKSTIEKKQISAEPVAKQASSQAGVKPEVASKASSSTAKQQQSAPQVKATESKTAAKSSTDNQSKSNAAKSSTASSSASVAAKNGKDQKQPVAKRSFFSGLFNLDNESEAPATSSATTKPKTATVPAPVKTESKVATNVPATSTKSESELKSVSGPSKANSKEIVVKQPPAQVVTKKTESAAAVASLKPAPTKTQKPTTTSTPVAKSSETKSSSKTQIVKPAPKPIVASKAAESKSLSATTRPVSSTTVISRAPIEAPITPEMKAFAIAPRAADPALTAIAQNTDEPTPPVAGTVPPTAVPATTDAATIVGEQSLGAPAYSVANNCPRCGRMCGSTCCQNDEIEWEDSYLVPWEAFAQGEYIGPSRLAHVAEYRLRVDDVLECVYRITGQVSSHPYRLNVGDQLQIESTTAADVERSVLIQPDGRITLPQLGQIPAAGRTIDELRDDLTERYKQFINDPSITVTPTNLNSTLTELRATVDNRFGSGGQGRQVRVTPEGTIQLPGIGSVLAQGLTLDELQAEIHGRYDEIVQGMEVTPILSARAPRFVYVTGEVATPGRFTMEAPTTVMQAIAMAGSWNVGADLENVVVFRRDENWNLVATKLDLKKALFDPQPCPADEIFLRDSDIVVIPKNCLLKTDNFLQLLFTDAIYRVVPFSTVINYQIPSSVGATTVIP